MTLREHLKRIADYDITPRVIEHNATYRAWTSTWEGPARPDFPTAMADLNDWLRARNRAQKHEH
jgi:hypothetical protein